MFSLRVQKSIQKPSKFGFKNPWKFEHHLCQLKVKMLHFWSQKAIKMRSKILENQVRSGQLSSCQFFVVGPRPPRWSGRGGGPNVIVGCVPPPKRSSAAFDRGGQTGPPRSNVFFFRRRWRHRRRRRPPSRTTGRAFARPNIRPDARRHARPDVPADPNQKPFHKL